MSSEQQLQKPASSVDKTVKPRLRLRPMQLAATKPLRLLTTGDKLCAQQQQRRRQSAVNSLGKLRAQQWVPPLIGPQLPPHVPIEQLPTELQLEICQYLDWPAAIKLSQTNRHFQILVLDIFKNETRFKRKLEIERNVLQLNELYGNDSTSWRFKDYRACWSCSRVYHRSAFGGINHDTAEGEIFDLCLLCDGKDVDVSKCHRGQTINLPSGRQIRFCLVCGCSVSQTSDSSSVRYCPCFWKIRNMALAQAERRAAKFACHKWGYVFGTSFPVFLGGWTFSKHENYKQIRPFPFNVSLYANRTAKAATAALQRFYKLEKA